MKASNEALGGDTKTASCAVRVSMDKLGRVFLSFVKEVEYKSKNQAHTCGFHSTVALDPGVPTFKRCRPRLTRGQEHLAALHYQGEITL